MNELERVTLGHTDIDKARKLAMGFYWFRRYDETDWSIIELSEDGTDGTESPQIWPIGWDASEALIVKHCCVAGEFIGPLEPPMADGD